MIVGKLCKANLNIVSSFHFILYLSIDFVFFLERNILLVTDVVLKLICCSEFLVAIISEFVNGEFFGLPGPCLHRNLCL